jgi:flagellar biosynthesis anti-sigma factor FlgM
MKIDGHHHASDTQATDGARRTATDGNVRKGGPVASSAASSDRVELSGDAALLAAARKAAEEGTGVRSQLVEQMRQKLQAGKVGTDAGRLADAILEDLLK